MFHIKGVDFNKIISLYVCCRDLVSMTVSDKVTEVQFDLHGNYGVYLTNQN